jgi:APA family basic amino acid/polyamine antiporter
MARNGQLPKSIARITSKFGTPYISILGMSALLTVLAYALELKEAAAITSFSILCTHLSVNISALRLRKKMSAAIGFKAPFYPAIPLLGLASCVLLMFSLPVESWIVAAVVVLFSGFLYLLQRK